MKKLFLAIGFCALTAFVVSKVMADGNTPSADEQQLEATAKQIYKQIDFSKVDRLSYDVFEKAYRGFINLRMAGKVSWEKDIITVCNFNLPSTENRLWIIDLATHQVLFNTYVAHGQGSGDDCADKFSNKFESHQSSLGFYVTNDTYNGEHGLSLRLDGVDPGYNDAALQRGIVLHGASYVSGAFVAGNVRLGRSWGCPAVPDQLKVPIINTIVGGTCLFIYYPDADYLKHSCWLNKKPDFIPDNWYSDMLPAPKAKPSRVIVEYHVHGNKVDSVRTEVRD